ncbi:Hypothetical predicted protein, partial [Pelobates cultripes]
MAAPRVPDTRGPVLNQADTWVLQSQTLTYLDAVLERLCPKQDVHVALAVTNTMSTTNSLQYAPSGLAPTAPATSTSYPPPLKAIRVLAPTSHPCLQECVGQ